MALSEARSRELVAADEGQYHDRKSLFEGPPGGKRPRDRRTVRDQIAEQIAGCANADGGVVIFGVEDDHLLTGHGYPADVVDQMLAVPQTRLVPRAVHHEPGQSLLDRRAHSVRCEWPVRPLVATFVPRLGRTGGPKDDDFLYWTEAFVGVERVAVGNEAVVVDAQNVYWTNHSLARLSTGTLNTIGR